MLTGHNGDQVGALVWLHSDCAHRCALDGRPDADLRRELEDCLAWLAAEAVRRNGSSV